MTCGVTFPMRDFRSTWARRWVGCQNGVGPRSTGARCLTGGAHARLTVTLRRTLVGQLAAADVVLTYDVLDRMNEIVRRV